MAIRKPATNGRHYDGGGKGGARYKEFADEPNGSHFDGPANEQKAFFGKHSNYEERISEISRSYDHTTAFEEWVGGHFMDGQQYGGWDKMSERSKRYTQSYDDILDDATLGAGVVVRRKASASLVLGKGHSSPTLAELQAMEGRTITSHGNMSTSAAAHGIDVAGKQPIEYKIRIPKGSTGAGMWIGDSRINGFGASEREFMMNRDTVFRVGKTRQDSRGVYVTELTYVGREPHDYGKSGRV